MGGGLPAAGKRLLPKAPGKTLLIPRSSRIFALPLLEGCGGADCRSSVRSFRLAGRKPEFGYHAQHDTIDPVVHGSVGNDTHNAPFSIIVLDTELFRLDLLDDVEQILFQ